MYYSSHFLRVLFLFIILNLVLNQIIQGQSKKREDFIEHFFDSIAQKETTPKDWFKNAIIGYGYYNSWINDKKLDFTHTKENLDNALIFYEKGFSYALNNINKDKYANEFLQNLLELYHDSSQFHKYEYLLNFMEKHIVFRDDLQYLKLLETKQHLYMHLLDADKAIENLNRILNLTSNLNKEHKFDLNYTFESLLKTFENANNIANYEFYIKKLEQLNVKNHDINEPLLLYHKANLFKQKSEYLSAIRQQKKLSKFDRYKESSWQELAELNFQVGNMDASSFWLEKSLDSTNYNTSVNWLRSLLYAKLALVNQQRDSLIATKYFKSSLKIINNLRDDKYLFYESHEEKFNMLQNFSEICNYLNTFLHNNSYNPSSLTNEYFNTLLFLDQNIVQSSNRINQLYYRENLFFQEEATYNLKTLKNLKTKLHLNEKKKLTIADSSHLLKSKIAKLEKELLRNYQSFNKSYTSNSLKTDIKNGLNIYFHRFKYHDPKKNKAQYVAFIYSGNTSDLNVIDLFSETQLKTILKSKNNNSIYKLRGNKSKKLSSKSMDLYQLIFEPLEDYLEAGSTINIYPSGLLHQISFSAISKESVYLNNLYNFHRVTSIKKQKLGNLNSNNSIQLFGNIDYNKTKTHIRYNSYKSLSKISRNNINDSTYWQPLEGSATEIENIEKLAKKYGYKIKINERANASESYFMSLDGNSPQIIHFATHGFFFEEPLNKTVLDNDIEVNNIYTKSQNPLFRSGLIMSNGNSAWNDFNQQGILTASEISNMNLSQTDLVVLSACETGLGEINNFEGVYGLQRAFKMAGVNNIIMTLWSISDLGASEFMNIFYTYYFQSKDAHDAMQKTKLKMQTEYRKRKNDKTQHLYAPDVWAAFVLME